jgi:hypothetical protein
MRKLLLASAATMGALLVTVGGAQAQPVTPVAPGTIAVHLNGYLQFGIGYFGSSANTVTTAAGTSKLNPYNTIGDARLYAGFDAQTLNGIEYGTQIELRITASDAGDAAGKKTGAAGSAGTESFYVKRAYGYIGAAQAGFVRFGQTDSAFSLLQTGVIEGYGDGSQFNSDGGIFNAIPSNAEPGNFIYADTSGLYATDKIVYLSPTIAGFSMGAGFEPSSDGLKEGTANCSNAASLGGAGNSACNDIASSPLSNATFRRNTIDAAVMYAGTFGGFANKASVGILNSAPIRDTALGSTQFRGMTVYQAGVQTSFAGFTLGGNVKGGSVEDAYAFKPAGARNGLTYIVGGTYTIGPWVVGTSFYDGQTAGKDVPGVTHGVARTLSEYGIAAGGNYVISKDLSLYLQYEYGHVHQPGFNFVAGAANTTSPGGSGNAQFQTIATGATFKW